MSPEIFLAQVAQSTGGIDGYLIAGFTLFGIALVLLAMELVIPSAGMLATLCALSIAAGVVCFFLHAPLWGFASLALSLGGAPFAIGFGIRMWSGTPLANRAVLDSEVRTATPENLPSVGSVGLARTSLRPIGRIEIADVTYEAMAEDGFIEAGQTVRVVSHQDGTLRVRWISPT